MSRLGKAVAARQAELGLSDHEVHAAGGPAPATLQRVKSGEAGFRATTYRRLDRGLRWLSGTAKAYTIPPAGERQHDGPHVCRAVDLTDEELLAEIARRLGERGANSGY